MSSLDLAVIGNCSYSALIDRQARIGDQGPLRTRHQLWAGIDIEFVFDFADDLLDQILDRNQTVDAAIFIDDQRHMKMGHLHLKQQVQDRHRRRNEQNLAQDAAQAEGGALAHFGEDILDMHHPDNVIQGFTVDRHAGMGVGIDLGDQIVQRRIDVDGAYIGAWHHDVMRAKTTEHEDIGDQGAFARVD